MPAAAARTLTVLNALAQEPEGLSLAQLVQATGIARASLGRLLDSLVTEGAVLDDEGNGHYRPSLTIWEPASALITELRVREVAFPYMVELSRGAHNQVNLALPEFPDVVYMETVLALDERVTSRFLATRHHALATASGRVMVAFADEGAVQRSFATPIPKSTPNARVDKSELIEELATIREAGYAVIDREHDAEVSGLAVPLFDHTGRPVGALGLSRRGALEPNFVELALDRALSTAQRISGELGYRRGRAIALA